MFDPKSSQGVNITIKALYLTTIWMLFFSVIYLGIVIYQLSTFRNLSYLIVIESGYFLYLLFLGSIGIYLHSIDISLDRLKYVKRYQVSVSLLCVVQLGILCWAISDQNHFKQKVSKALVGDKSRNMEFSYNLHLVLTLFILSLDTCNFMLWKFLKKKVNSSWRIHAFVLTNQPNKSPSAGWIEAGQIRDERVISIDDAGAKTMTWQKGRHKKKNNSKNFNTWTNGT